MKKITFEVCCGSYEDCLIAQQMHVERVELNSALFLGGLTPSLASFIEARKNTELEIMVMIRPRGAGFCYDQYEFEIMLADAKIFLEYGADGIVFGCLTHDSKINMPQTKQMIELIQSYNKQVIIHRAFDCIEDSQAAIETYIELGVNRILTAGKHDKVTRAIDFIAMLQATYGKRIEILPGSGLNAQNIVQFINATNCNQVHSSCKSERIDCTTSQKNFNFAYLNHGDYETVDAQKIADMQNAIKTISQ